MTAPADALARIDDGIPLPADRALAELFDRHLRWDARPCLVCGAEFGGPECVTCVIAHDQAVERSVDV